MNINATVAYTAIAESVVVDKNGADVLTKECEVSGTLGVNIPEDAHPHYAAVIIADAICRAHNFEIKGKYAGVPALSIEHRRDSGKINIGRSFGNTFVISGYLTVIIDENKNNSWLSIIGVPGFFADASDYLNAMY